MPEVFVFASEDEDEAASELQRRVHDLGTKNPFVLTSRHGRRLAATVIGDGSHEMPPAIADREWATRLGSHVRSREADLIVAVGGGRTLDLAKVAAAKAGIRVMTVPTQLSHDGICSPVAVVTDQSGRTHSVGAITPHAVFISLATLRGAPPPSVAAGIGDLLANPLALRDWSLAADRGLVEVDQRAWDLSVESYRVIEPYLETDPIEMSSDPELLQRLADALILSGMAMIQAGSSRPASGGEHEIAHAIDELHGAPALHGAQVAFGCIVSVALYGEDHRTFRERLLRLGLPQNPRELGLSEDDLVRLLLHAPNTRPGRFTILEDSNLDESGARILIKKIWAEE
jgi:glycerol-1-phosphate dehydrogenase [NAD(P)+]